MVRHHNIKNKLNEKRQRKTEKQTSFIPHKNNYSKRVHNL